MKQKAKQDSVSRRRKILWRGKEQEIKKKTLDKSLMT